MSFEGVIRKVSHEGGALAEFEGEAPRLGQYIRLRGGENIGKIDTVIGADGERKKVRVARPSGEQLDAV